MGMLYEYDEVEPFNKRERRALASEGRQGVSETAFAKWWRKSPSGERYADMLSDSETAQNGWNAALEWAAGQVKAAGCSGCQVAITPSRYRPAGEDPLEHGPRCPVSLAAKIREGAP